MLSEEALILVGALVGCDEPSAAMRGLATVPRADELERAAKTEARRSRAHSFVSPMPGMGQEEHVDDRRHKHERVKKEPRRSAKKKHTRASHRRPEKNPEMPAGGIESHRAL